MKSEKAQGLIDKIIKGLEKNGFVPEKIVPDLKELRPYALEEEDPLVTKAIRLSWEYIEEFNTFQVGGAEDEDEEGNPIMPEIGDDKTQLLDLMTMMKKSENEFNRTEMRSYALSMKQELY